MDESKAAWLICKHGLYYRPGASGYTGNVCDAWLLPKSEAEKHINPDPFGPVTIKHISEVSKAALAAARADAEAAVCAGSTTAELEALGPGGVKKALAIMRDLRSEAEAYQYPECYEGLAGAEMRALRDFLDRVDKAKEANHAPE